MATSSICKNISVKNRNQCRALVNALENASKKCAIDVQIGKKCREVKGEKIKELFGKK